MAHEKYGYQAKYVQEWNSRIYTYFFPWELSFGIRNKSSDIFTNGYGVSELEDMVQIVTWLLFCMQYNGISFRRAAILKVLKKLCKYLLNIKVICIIFAKK